MTKPAIKTKTKSNVMPLNTQPTMPKIEKGIPVPTRTNHWAYLAGMNKSDSVFISEKLYNVDSSVNSIRSWAASNKLTITVRKVEGGARVWRV